MDSNTELAAELNAAMNDADRGIASGVSPSFTDGHRRFIGLAWSNREAIIDALTQQPADHIPDASNMVPAEQQSKVLHSALVASLDDWQNPIQTSDPRPPKNQLKPAPLSSLRVVPAEQIADGALRPLDFARLDGITSISLMGLRQIASYQDEADRANAAIRSSDLPKSIAQQARAQALEEAAKVAESRGEQYCEPTQSDYDRRDGAYAAASAIRALQPHGQGGGE